MDVGFGDLVKNLELGFMAHGEAWKGDWGIMTDIIFLELGSDISLPVLGVLDIGLQEVIAEGLLGRRFVDDERQIDVFAGIRYWDLDMNLELESGPGDGLDFGDSWVDPVVGARLVQGTDSDWFVMLRGDVGGFGLGSSFSWNVQGGVGYEVSDRFSVVAQYKALGVDFENDEAGSLDFLSYDTTTNGPLLGFVFQR